MDILLNVSNFIIIFYVVMYNICSDWKYLNYNIAVLCVVAGLRLWNFLRVGAISRLFSTKSWNLRCCSEYHWLGHLKFKIVAKICTNKYFLGYEKCLFSWIWKILRLKRTLIFLFFAIKMKIPLLSWIFYIECMEFESILKIR